MVVEKVKGESRRHWERSVNERETDNGCYQESPPCIRHLCKPQIGEFKSSNFFTFSCLELYKHGLTVFDFSSRRWHMTEVPLLPGPVYYSGKRYPLTGTGPVKHFTLRSSRTWHDLWTQGAQLSNVSAVSPFGDLLILRRKLHTLCAHTHTPRHTFTAFPSSLLTLSNKPKLFFEHVNNIFYYYTEILVLNAS